MSVLVLVRKEDSGCLCRIPIVPLVAVSFVPAKTLILIDDSWKFAASP